MIETWRWFGPDDPVTLADIRQAGATGIVTALHELPNGAVWPREAIAARQEMIAEAGLTWQVVESVPVHEDIKIGAPGWERYADAWAESIRNLAAQGIGTVCYNFMPMLDWTRTDLAHELPNGARCLRFDNVDAAVFDLHILGREGAEADHAREVRQAARARHDGMDDAAIAALTDTILAGLPGAEESFTLDGFRAHLSRYDGIGAEGLRANLAAFLQRVVPVAEQAGVKLAIHPDDPPRPLFGLPRIVSCAADLDWIAAAVPSLHNGFTFCTGSLGVRPDNDLPAMMRAHAARIHFLHLRSTKREADGLSFFEADHLAGDVDMVAVVAEALRIERAQGAALPFRPDHGHALADDQRRRGTPGYPLVGRLRGLAEIRGLALGLSARL